MAIDQKCMFYQLCKLFSVTNSCHKCIEYR